MPGNGARQKLIDFLDEQAFQPVLRASEEDFPQGKRDELRNVQRATEADQERFRNYDSAEKVLQMYRDDLSSDAAKKIHAQLRELGLPTIVDVRRDFEDLARELGVRS